MLAASRDGTPELVSRLGNNFADRFPEISIKLLSLPDVVLDGELVIVDGEGRPQGRATDSLWVKVVSLVQETACRRVPRPHPVV